MYTNIKANFKTKLVVEESGTFHSDKRFSSSGK